MLAYEYVFLLMLAVLLFTILYPWHPAWWGAKWLVHLPLLLPPLWLLYELLIPSEYNIRLDIPLIGFGLIVAGLIYLSKLALFALIAFSKRTT